MPGGILLFLLRDLGHGCRPRMQLIARCWIMPDLMFNQYFMFK
jgi:hypothetical protein